MRSRTPTLAQIFKSQGFRINMSTFDGVSLDASFCTKKDCAHGNGMIPLLEVVKAALNSRKTPVYWCSLMTRPSVELRAFSDFCVSVFNAHSRVINLLVFDALYWQDSWNDFLLPRTPGQDLKTFYESWLWSKLVEKEELVYEKFLQYLEESGVWKIPPPAVSGEEPMVMMRPLDVLYRGWGWELCELRFGYCGMPGVLMLPERLVRVLPSDEASFLFCNREGFPGPNFPPPGGTAWLLADVPFEEPVRVLPEHTPAVLETASVLLESLTLKEALQAALTV